jgi:hypothetical protein
MATEIDDGSLGGTPKEGVLSKVFSSCSSDPRGSVHRAWGISLLFVVLYFVLAVIESESVESLLDVCVLEEMSLIVSHMHAAFSFSSGQLATRRWIRGASRCFNLDRSCTFGIGRPWNFCLETIPDILFGRLFVGCSSGPGKPKFDIVWNLYAIRSGL